MILENLWLILVINLKLCEMNILFNSGITLEGVTLTVIVL